MRHFAQWWDKRRTKGGKKIMFQIIQILNIGYYEPSLHSDDLCLNEPFPQIIDWKIQAIWILWKVGKLGAPAGRAGILNCFLIKIILLPPSSTWLPFWQLAKVTTKVHFSIFLKCLFKKMTGETLELRSDKRKPRVILRHR